MDKKWLKFKRINTFLVIFLVVIIFSYIVIRISFPVFSYFLSPNKFGYERITKEKIVLGNFLVVNPDFNYFYNELKIELTASKEYQRKNLQVAILKGYLAQLYPLGETITSKEALEKYLFTDEQKLIANGTIFAYQDAVFIVEKGEKRPFSNKNVFEYLGLKWESLQEVDKSIISDLPKGEAIWFSSHHPDGIILEENQEGKENLFLINQGRLLPIKDKKLLSSVWPDFYTIKIKTKEPYYLGKMTLNSSFKGKFNIDQEQKVDEITGYYLFQFDDLEFFDQIEDAKITFDTWGRFKKQTAISSLRVIKNDLLLKYWPKIIK